MRVAVITLHAVQNYGSVLQALATQELLEQHGCEVEIINYVRENVKYKNLPKTWGKGNPLKTLIILPTILRWKRVFREFCESNLHLSKHQYTTDIDFQKYPINADIFCTGSDQVWNSKWNRGYILPLYLNFVPDDKYRFAFASSFGQSELSEEEVSVTKTFIDRYNKISVRERYGVDILNSQYDYDESEHLIDPTLALSSNFWRRFKKTRKIKEDYILIYNLNRSKAFDEYAVNLSKKTGLKLVRFCTRYDQFYRPGKSMLVPDVADFITLIDDATFVLTDSFHATAFSINMNTVPICIYPKEFGGRLESFLNLVNCMSCHASGFDDFNVINNKVDFEAVNNILLKERAKVNDFIDGVLNDANEYYSHKVKTI